MSDREPMWRRYRDLLRRRPDEDVDDEVQHHLEMRRTEALRGGLDPDKAAAVARERFGDVEGVVAELYEIDRSRERRRSRVDWLGDLAQDARFAVRSLRRAPAFAATAIITLAVSIAANTTIFSFVHALLLEPLPYRRPNELVTVEAPIVASIGEMFALRERARSFADIGMFRTRSITLSDERDAARLDGVVLTPNLLPMLGVPAMAGVIFDESTSRPGAGNVILLSHSLWMERFGGDRGVVGRTVMVDGAPFAIAGIMPPTFHFPSIASRFWIPMTIDRSNTGSTWAIAGGRFVARLKPGVPASRASAEVASVVPGLRHLNPIWDPGDGYGRGAVARPLHESLMARERPVLLLLEACVVVVLLVACVNLANLMLARVTGREREFTVRAAVGGGRSRLVRQLLTESCTIALAGAALGVVLSLVGVRWGVASLPPSVVRTSEIHISVAVLAFTAALSVLTGVAFGMLPALRAASLGGSTQTVLGTRGSSRTGAHHRMSSALVAGEMALAVLLAITAGLLTRSFAHLRDLSPGFRTERVVSALISPPAQSYKDAMRTTSFYAEVIDRVSAIPGVTSSALVDRLPIAGPVYGMGMRVEGQFEDIKHLLPTAHHVLVITPKYFSVFGIPVLRGRAFDDDDRADAPSVTIVSQSLARRFWPNGDAIGKRIGYPYPSPWLTIVGVVPDVRIDSLRDTASLAVYVPFKQRLSFAATEMSIVARTSAEPQAIASGVRDIVASIDRTVPVTRVRAMDEVIAQSVAKPRFTTVLVGGFALAALLLGATGVYGVMSYVVSERAHEMGVRVALGATPADIVRLVVGRSVLLAIAGAAAGCVMALVATRGLRSLLFGVSSSDPLTFAVAVGLFVVVAVAASALPARRATRVDPVQALRDA
jgi:putative ABC transport system permease protein